jgi:hypothetical protein
MYFERTASGALQFVNGPSEGAAELCDVGQELLSWALLRGAISVLYC